MFLTGIPIADAAVTDGKEAEMLPPPIPGKSAPDKPGNAKRIEPRFSRGQLLYENHCTECHTSVAHIRADRRVRTMKDLEAWVMRWAGQRKLQWSADDVAEVVDYLNGRYYQLTPNESEK